MLSAWHRGVAPSERSYCRRERSEESPSNGCHPERSEESRAGETDSSLALGMTPDAWIDTASRPVAFSDWRASGTLHICADQPLPQDMPVPDPIALSSDAELRAVVERALSANYEIDREIGRGGMGIVYRAKDRRLKRTVAVKLLPPELAYRREIKSRFLREAETAAQLNHPNVVPIYTVDEREGLVYFVMACVDGCTLAKRMADVQRFDIDEARRILREVAEALSYAHARGAGHHGLAPHGHGDGDRHARVHEPRAGRRRPRDRWTQRSLLAWRRRLSDARGRAAVHRVEHAGNADEAHRRAADPGGAASPGHSAAARGDGDDAAREGARSALRERGRAAPGARRPRDGDCTAQRHGNIAHGAAAHGAILGAVHATGAAVAGQRSRAPRSLGALERAAGAALPAQLHPVRVREQRHRAGRDLHRGELRPGHGDLGHLHGVQVLQAVGGRSEEHTSELQSHVNLVCRLLLEKK